MIDPELDQGTIDMCGIDNHHIKGLKIVSVGGVVNSTFGEIIIILHQQARMPDGKTILSCGQMEHFKTIVVEKSPAVNNGIHPYIETNEGCKIPIKINNGLPYIKVRPYTDHEWERLPHIHLTEDKEWDPSVLDSMNSSNP